mmetsp:Transcript_27447/g.68219  ORF Transcript_27447/g.68219 Transcript_27447/m.68219 type:complete len:353 (+) Transcript_27447:755-1813(+)
MDFSLSFALPIKLSSNSTPYPSRVANFRSSSRNHWGRCWSLEMCRLYAASSSSLRFCGFRSICPSTIASACRLMLVCAERSSSPSSAESYWAKRPPTTFSPSSGAMSTNFASSGTPLTTLAFFDCLAGAATPGWPAAFSAAVLRLPPAEPPPPLSSSPAGSTGLPRRPDGLPAFSPDADAGTSLASASLASTSVAADAFAVAFAAAFSLAFSLNPLRCRFARDASARAATSSSSSSSSSPSKSGLENQRSAFVSPRSTPLSCRSCTRSGLRAAASSPSSDESSSTSACSSYASRSVAFLSSRAATRRAMSSGVSLSFEIAASRASRFFFFEVGPPSSSSLRACTARRCVRAR